MYKKLLIPKYLKRNFSKHEICFFSLWFPAMSSQAKARSTETFDVWMGKIIALMAGMFWGPAEGSSTLFCLNSMLLLLSRFSRVLLCGPHRWKPTRLPVPGILQARTLEWVAISFSNARKWRVNVKLLSRVQLLATPWTAVYQAPLHGIFQAKVLEWVAIAFSVRDF